ncbi:MAG: hypothetical protein QW117_01340 [Candidatus Pacearchaeota archaeon]
MKIKEMKSLSMAESLNLIENIEMDEEKRKELKGFIKKFIKLKNEDAISLRKELESLDLIKIKSEHISKIIDFLPENVSELNKILVDVVLNEEETNKILDIVKKYK